MSTPPPRPAPTQVVLTVDRVEWLSPHMVRVVAGGPGFADFPDKPATDKYAKLFFAPAGSTLTPPYDMAAIRESLPVEQWPVVRTYTVRWVDAAAQQLAIDFVVHGDTGVAGPWAASAVAGDVLVLSTPGGAYAPSSETTWHVFAGDESAIPAIGAALEALDDDATGVAHLEIGDESDKQRLSAPDGVTINWIIRGAGDPTKILAHALEAGDWSGEEHIQVFAHGERESMKAVRDVLKTRGIERSQLSLSGYWARGRSEDAFQSEKREPIGKILD